jgi:hypothetical protein
MFADPHLLDSERTALDAFLDGQRECLIRKVDGVDGDDARRTPTASTLSLAGLIQPATVWERRWFQVVVAGRDSHEAWPDVPGVNEHTFAVDDTVTVDALVQRYRAQIEQSRLVAAATDLDAVCVRTDLIECNLRYVLLHMIEETARHAGHADIIRETLDGTTGI